MARRCRRDRPQGSRRSRCHCSTDVSRYCPDLLDSTVRSNGVTIAFARLHLGIALICGPEYGNFDGFAVAGLGHLPADCFAYAGADFFVDRIFARVPVLVQIFPHVGATLASSGGPKSDQNHGTSASRINTGVLSIFDKGLQNPSRTWFETPRELNAKKPRNRIKRKLIDLCPLCA